MTSSRPIARPASRARARSLASRANERTKFHAFVRITTHRVFVVTHRPSSHSHSHSHSHIRIRDGLFPVVSTHLRTIPPHPSRARSPPPVDCADAAGRIPTFSPARARSSSSLASPLPSRSRSPLPSRSRSPPSRRSPHRRSAAAGGPRSAAGDPWSRPNRSSIPSRAGSFDPSSTDPSSSCVARPVPSRRHRHARDRARVSALDDAPLAFVRSVRVDSRGVRYTLKPPRDR